jgi:hypothetical protein
VNRPITKDMWAAWGTVGDRANSARGANCQSLDDFQSPNSVARDRNAIWGDLKSLVS